MGYRKLGRTSDQRKAMLRDLATSLIISERIETTEARAKEVRSVVEKLITLGKKGDLASRRNAAKTLRNVEILNEDETTQTALQKLFGEIAERYTERQGGNLQKVRILVDGKPKKVWVSARALKSGKVTRV